MYGVLGAPSKERSFSSLVLYFWLLLCLCGGPALTAQGISLAQQRTLLADIGSVFSNGTELYFIVFLMVLYSLLQVLNIFRVYGVVMIEFVAMLGFICIFLCGSVVWLATQIPSAAWELRGEENAMCTDLGVFCNGLFLMSIGPVIFILGVLMIQPFQLFILHQDKPLSPWTKFQQEREKESDVQKGPMEIMEEKNRAEREQEQMMKFWLSTVVTFQFLHGLLVLIQLCVFIPFLVAVVYYIREAANTEYNKTSALSLCMAVALLIVGMLVSIFLLLDHGKRLQNYLFSYFLNIINAAALGMAAFLGGGCKILMAPQAELCTFSSVMFWATLLLFLLIVIDQAIALVSVGFGAAISRKYLSVLYGESDDMSFGSDDESMEEGDISDTGTSSFAGSQVSKKIRSFVGDL